VGAVVGAVVGLVAAVVVFVLFAMDAGRYRWATEVIGSSIDWMVRRVRALVRRT
jgi:hypothetical protein